MAREIIFDTETTGLESKFDRVIEIGGVELVDHFPTGRTFHVYISPGDRKVHPDAFGVHGLSDDFLKDKPGFSEIVEDLLEFFKDAKWVAHNANFDIGFMNAEFERLGLPPIAGDQIIDTLALARRKHPMGPNSLDALCRRYNIDNSHRTKHGALLDSELLAEVYIEMIGGRQTALGLVEAKKEVAIVEDDEELEIIVLPRSKPLPARLSDADADAHFAMITKMGGKAIWKQYQ